jgi:hypothetical protein
MFFYSKTIMFAIVALYETGKCAARISRIMAIIIVRRAEAI